MSEKKFKTKDRVRRKNSEASACSGTILLVSEEVTASDSQKNDKSYLYTVQWDNGTKSVFGVDGLVLEV